MNQAYLLSLVEGFPNFLLFSWELENLFNRKEEGRKTKGVRSYFNYLLVWKDICHENGQWLHHACSPMPNFTTKLSYAVSQLECEAVKSDLGMRKEDDPLISIQLNQFIH